VLIPQAPLGVMTTAVQALAGVLLPSATVFLLLLCNDREVLGPWVNRPWLNALSTTIVGVLLMLSAILVVSVVLPSVDIGKLVVGSAVFLTACLVVGGAVVLRSRGARVGPPEVSREERLNWRMPPLTLLQRPVWTRGRTVGMYALRGYLVIAVLLLIVKAAEVASGHH
jgi:hypothetical protein